MKIDQEGSNNKIKEQSREYKDDCAGLNCINQGFHRLKIRYIDKYGTFCNSCKTDLEQSGLVCES
jgi:hypothetical protein